MARLLFWSDLHLAANRAAPFTPPARRDVMRDGPIDGVLLAGDINEGLGWIDFAAMIHDLYEVPVVMVWGNHEPYGHNVDVLMEQEAEKVAAQRAQGRDLRILHGAATEIAGARIVGATLWSDFTLRGNSPFAMIDAQAGMTDYRLIRTSATTTPARIANNASPEQIAAYAASRLAGRRIVPEDTLAWHRRDRATIASLLEKPHAGPTVVMTHHMPLPQCIHQMYANDRLTPAFCNNMTAEIAEWLDRNAFDYWIYGHSHVNLEFSLQRADGGQAHFVSNPHGYPFEGTRFAPIRIIDARTTNTGISNTGISGAGGEVSSAGAQVATEALADASAEVSARGYVR